MSIEMQQAYYLNAQNPANIKVLIDVAKSIGLEPEQFKHDLASQAVEVQLHQDIQLARKLSAQGFPSLMLRKEGKAHAIPLHYTNSHKMQQAIVNIARPAEPSQ